jgi:hypothetical protein
LRRVQALDLTTWIGDARDHVISIAVEKVTGRRLFQAQKSVQPPRTRTTAP